MKKRALFDAHEYLDKHVWRICTNQECADLIVLFEGSDLEYGMFTESFAGGNKLHKCKCGKMAWLRTDGKFGAMFVQACPFAIHVRIIIPLHGRDFKRQSICWHARLPGPIIPRRGKSQQPSRLMLFVELCEDKAYNRLITCPCSRSLPN